MISLYNVMEITLRWTIFNYMLDIGILQKYSLKDVGVLKGEFWSLGVQMKFRQPAGLDFIVVTSYIHMV